MDPKQNAIQIEARTLELALQKAALTLGVSPDRLSHEVIKDNSSGLMSLLTGRRIQISAWRIPGKPVESRSDEGTENRGYRNDRNSDRSHSRGGDRRGSGRGGYRSNNGGSRDQTTAPDQGRSYSRDQGRDQGQDQGRNELNNSADFQQEPATPRVPPRPLAPEELVNLKTEIAEFFKAICERIVGRPIAVHVREEEDRLCLEADDAELGELLQKNNKLSEAFEHLLRKKPRHLQQELPYRIFIDFGGVRKKREDELVQMAQDLSSQVHENQRPIVLNYRSPYERKVIHMALDKDQRVFTKSIGSGPGRKLMILPSSGDRNAVHSAADYAEV